LLVAIVMELFQSFATHDCLERQSVVLAGNDGANRFMGAALSIKDQAGVVETWGCGGLG
jgi:hypothetical protein